MRSITSFPVAAAPSFRKGAANVYKPTIVRWSRPRQCAPEGGRSRFERVSLGSRSFYATIIPKIGYIDGHMSSFSEINNMIFLLRFLPTRFFAALLPPPPPKPASAKRISGLKTHTDLARGLQLVDRTQSSVIPVVGGIDPRKRGITEWRRRRRRYNGNAYA